jgi:methylmalonyl-CoA mutase
MASTAQNNTLFEDFKKISAEEWKVKIVRDLKGADFQEKLVWHTYEGINVQPFYTAEDTQQLNYISNLQDLQATSIWYNREEILVKEAASANAQATEALNKGADAIMFDLTDVPLGGFAFAKLLTGININQTPVSFKTNEPEVLLKHIKQNNPSLTALKGSIIFDPLANWMQEGTPLADQLEKLLAIHQELNASSGFAAITIGSYQYHNAGASAVQELAFTLGSAITYIDYLTEQGRLAQDVFNNIELAVATGTNYFFEIAKLRALRWLWAKLAASYDAELLQFRLHASTSYWSKTVADPYVNMLRNTTEAMAALAGGCTSLTVLPYNIALTHEPDEFSRRISRNVSVILKEESFFDKTIDPTAGSYCIDKLTDSLVEAAWQLFLKIEEIGGIVKAFEKGFVQEEIQKVRDQKATNLQESKEVLVGTNKYINKNEQTVQALTAPDIQEKDGLQLLRPFHAFELLNKKTSLLG